MKRKTIFVALVLAASIFAGCRFSTSKTDSPNGTSSAVEKGGKHSGTDSAANEGIRSDDNGANRTEVTRRDENIRPDDKESNNGGEILPISWSFSPAQFRGKNNQQFSFKCLANGEPAGFFGTDVYTDDSSICMAAVHAGVITIASGGTVTIEIRPGQNAYIGSERNGVKSSDFNNSWLGSFVFVQRTSGS